MAVGDELVHQLRATLHLLEQADAEAVKAKHQVARIIGVDFETGTSIVLVASFFTVEGINYQATLTPEQRAAIQAAAGGSTQDVLNLVVGILSNTMVLGVDVALGILIAALKNEPIPQIATALNAVVGGPVKPPPPIGACIIGGVCKSNYDATLCQTLNGQPVPTCPEVGP
jgi:hypothetical protein